MARNYQLNKITSKRAYTTLEISKTLNIHIQTVRAWHTQYGLSPIEINTNPLLYLGSEIRAFLHKRLLMKKVKLKKEEFYCLKCRIAVKPINITILDRGILIGINKKSIQLCGNCPVCNTRIRKFSSQLILIKTNKKHKGKSENTNQISLF